MIWDMAFTPCIDDVFWCAATPAKYCAVLEQSSTGSFEITKSYDIENTYGIW